MKRCQRRSACAAAPGAAREFSPVCSRRFRNSLLTAQRVLVFAESAIFLYERGETATRHCRFLGPSSGRLSLGRGKKKRRRRPRRPSLQVTPLISVARQKPLELSETIPGISLKRLIISSRSSAIWTKNMKRFFCVLSVLPPLCASAAASDIDAPFNKIK